MVMTMRKMIALLIVPSWDSAKYCGVTPGGICVILVAKASMMFCGIDITDFDARSAPRKVNRIIWLIIRVVGAT